MQKTDIDSNPIKERRLSAVPAAINTNALRLQSFEAELDLPPSMPAIELLRACEFVMERQTSNYIIEVPACDPIRTENRSIIEFE